MTQKAALEQANRDCDVKDTIGNPQTIEKRPLVQVRIEELKAAMAAEVEVDAGWIIQEALKQYRRADGNHDVKEARQCLDQIARMTGTDKPAGPGPLDGAGGSGQKADVVDTARRIAFLLNAGADAIEGFDDDSGAD